MNPFNGSFSFSIDQLPSNTPLRVNIYALNSRKRSPVQVELDTRTLTSAERRIESVDTDHHQQDPHQPPPRERTSFFFDEFYSGYSGRFRNKHLVVGLIIATVALSIFLAIILIIIATVRKKSNSLQSRIQSVGTNGNSIELDGELKPLDKKSSLKHKRTTGDNQTTKFPSSHNLKETVFISSELNGAENKTVATDYGGTSLQDYALYGQLDGGDDETSMRSDNQLIAHNNQYAQAHHYGGNPAVVPNTYYQPERAYYQTLLPGHHCQSTLTVSTSNNGNGPPSYFELEPPSTSSVNSVGDNNPTSQSIMDDGSDGQTTFVSVYRSGSQSQPQKPDIIRGLTLGTSGHHHHQQQQHQGAPSGFRPQSYHHQFTAVDQDTGPSTDSTIFDTISFGTGSATLVNHHPPPPPPLSATIQTDTNSTTAILTRDQISGKKTQLTWLFLSFFLLSSFF